MYGSSSETTLKCSVFVIFSFAKGLKTSERKKKGWNGQSWCRTLLAPQELVPLISGNRAPFVRIKSRNWLETKVSEMISCEESKKFLWICKYVPLMVFSSDEFELKFPELIRAKLERFRAELGHFNFRAETELTICTSVSSKF